MSISRPGHERPEDERPALRRRRDAGDRATLLGRHQPEEDGPGERHHHAAGDGDREDERVVPALPALGEAGEEQPRRVDDGRPEDDAGRADAVTDAPGDDGRDRIAGGDGREDRRRDRQRLVEALDDVEDDERPHGGERPLPARHGEQEHPHVGQVEEDVAAHADVRANALVDAALAAVLSHPAHDGAAGDGRDDGGEQERRRVRHAEQEAAADEGDAEGDAAQDVLDALRAREDALVQEVRVQAAVRRLVDVVREEERHHDECRRPDVRHEREEREAEAHRDRARRA